MFLEPFSAAFFYKCKIHCPDNKRQMHKEMKKKNKKGRRRRISSISRSITSNKYYIIGFSFEKLS